MESIMSGLAISCNYIAHNLISYSPLKTGIVANIVLCPVYLHDALELIVMCFIEGPFW